MNSTEQTTEPTDKVEATTAATAEPEAGESSATPANQGDDQAATKEPASDNNEAAKYRRRLRETETERDTARTNLETLRRQVVEDASGLAKPAGLWAAGVAVDDLFDDEGRLDSEKLTAAVATATDALGLAPKPRNPRPDPSQGLGSKRTGPTGWADTLRRG